MAVNEHQTRHRFARRIGDVEVGGDDQSRARLEHQILDFEAVACDAAGYERRRLWRPRRQLANRAAEGVDFLLAEALPSFSRSNGGPGRGAGTVRRRNLLAQLAADCAAKLIALYLTGDVRRQLVESGGDLRLGWRLLSRACDRKDEQQRRGKRNNWLHGGTSVPPIKAVCTAEASWRAVTPPWPGPAMPARRRFHLAALTRGRPKPRRRARRRAHDGRRAA